MPEQILQKAEVASTRKTNSESDRTAAIEQARTLENDSFVNSVSGKSHVVANKSRFTGTIKKKGPLIFVVAGLAVLAGLIFLAQSLMPFAIVNRIIEEFNTNGISSVLRADNILDYQLSSPNDIFGLTAFQKESLEENNILPLDYPSSDSASGTLLAYKNPFDGPNSWKVVHGTSPSAPSITDIKNAYTAKYPNYIFGPVELVSINDAMMDADFKTPYTNASKSWRGGSSGWYDTLTTLNESIRGLQRSRFFAIGAQQANNISSAAVRNIMKGRTITRIDSADNVTEASEIAGDPNTVSNRSSSHSGFSKASLKAAAAVNAVSKLAGGYCMYVEMANRVQTIIQSVSTLQQLNLVTGYTEAVSRVQAGESIGSAAMHEYNNNMVQEDENGNSAIESAGFIGLFSSNPIDPDDESVKTATAEGAIAKLSNSSNPLSSTLAKVADGTSNFLQAMTQCTYIQGSLSVISSIVTIASLATGGTASLIEFGIQFIIGASASFLIKNFVDLLVDWFWDNYGDVLEKDLATAVFGPDLGNAFVSGANKYLSSNHQVGGGSPATRNSVMAFHRQQEIVLAEEAEYQRTIRSPFDIGSQYTFLGSIVYNLIPIANTSNATSIVKTLGGIINNSVSNLLPTASAVAETNFINSFGDCPTLESIGIAGDAYCNPYFISDTSTNTSVAMLRKLDEQDAIAATNNSYWKGTGNNTYLDPDEVIEVVYKLGGIESTTPTTVTDANGNTRYNFSINKNSNLYKYAMFCGARTSSWGFADANIADQLKNQRNSKWWNSIPIIGNLISSVVDMINAERDKDWISGYNCVAREYNPSCDICSDNMECFWQNQGKYYQRFIEDQRYLISIDDTAIDPVSVALGNYYEEYPLDRSYEGILARFSGMTKEDVVATLDFIEGLDYIAQYHPESRFSFINTTVNSEATEIIPEETTLYAIVSTEPKYIIYDTTRNKTVLV